MYGGFHVLGLSNKMAIQITNILRDYRVSLVVIPVKTGIHWFLILDSRFRGNDTLCLLKEKFVKNYLIYNTLTAGRMTLAWSFYTISISRESDKL